MNINQSHTNSTCSKCGASYERTPGQIKKWDRVCKPCTNARSRQWTINRLLAGKPTKFWKASPEQQKRYAAASAAKPDFKMKKAERDRLYALDPSNYPKLKARWLAATAISNGRLARQPCEVCGNAKVDAHHDDYSQPLKVRWLCKVHHAECHRAALNSKD